MHAQIAYDLFDAVFRQVAITAVQLQRLVRDIEAGVGDETLRSGWDGVPELLATIIFDGLRPRAIEEA